MSLTCVSYSTIESIHIQKTIDFDEEIIPQVGDIGKYQYIRYLLLNLIAIPVCINWLADLVLSADIPHCCTIPNMHGDVYQPYFLNNTYHLLYPPISSFAADEVSKDHESCHMYEPRCYEENRTDFSGCATVECQFGHYFPSNYSQPRVSMVNQFGLVCEKKHLKRVSSLVFMAGVLAGAFVIGYLSDKYGRRATMFSVIGLQILFGFILAFMYSYLSFICMRFLVGTTTAGLYVVIFVLGCELVGPKYRTFVGLGYEITFGLGYLVLAALGYLIHNWKVFQISISLSTVFLFLYWKAIPESPRWLMVTGNMKKAAEVIRKMAEENGVVLDKSIQHKFEMNEELEGSSKREKERDSSTRGSMLSSSLAGDTAITTGLMSSNTSVLDLLRYPKLRTRVLVSSGLWLVLSMVYYSLSLMADQFRGNLYLNICISGAVEIPATIIAYPLINKLGRKIPLIMFFLLSSLSLMTCVFLPKTWHTAITSAAMCGKFFITGGFAIAYVYSAELYPTTLRNNGVGINSIFGRIGALMSPAVLLMGELWWLKALFASLSLLCLLASLGVMFLPETKNSPLPETINKIEGNVDLIVPKRKKNVSFGSLTSNISGLYSEVLVKNAESRGKADDPETPKSPLGSYRRMHISKPPEPSLYNISSSDNASEALEPQSGAPFGSRGGLSADPDNGNTGPSRDVYRTRYLYRMETTV